MRKGQLYILSGPSGSGKDTILKIVLERLNDLELSISSITRKMRTGEVNGEKYNFISREAFEQMLAEDAFLEHNVYADEYYGSPRKPVENHLKNGKDVILEIDVNGARQIREKCRDAISIFILPPSFEELKNRLLSRGTETEQKQMERLNIALEEIKCADEYDYIVVNDNLEEACNELASIITCYRCKLENRNYLLKEF